MARLRVVLAEDGSFPHGTLRDGLTKLDVDVVAEGSDWALLSDEAVARSADLFVAVLGDDPRLWSGGAHGDRPVIVVAESASHPGVATAIDHGAFGFVPFPLDVELFRVI